MYLATAATTADVLPILLALLSLGLLPAALDKVAQSPKAARWDRALHRALGGRDGDA